MAPRTPDDGGTCPRWRPSALIPALLCVVGVALISCQDTGGACGPSTTSPAGSAGTSAPALRPRYALVRVDGAPLPAVLADSGGTRVELVADTLAFTVSADGTRGTYAENVVVTVRQSGTTSITQSIPAAREWTRIDATAIALPAFSGGRAPDRATATVVDGAGPTGSLLTVVTAAARSYAYEAR